MDLKSKSSPGWDLSLSHSKLDAREIFKELDEQARNRKRTEVRQTAFQFLCMVQNVLVGFGV